MDIGFADFVLPINDTEGFDFSGAMSVEESFFLTAVNSVNGKLNFLINFAFRCD